MPINCPLNIDGTCGEHHTMIACPKLGEDEGIKVCRWFFERMPITEILTIEERLELVENNREIIEVHRHYHQPYKKEKTKPW